MNIFSKAVLLAAVFAGSIFAQHFDFGYGIGVKGGVPLTDALVTSGIVNPGEAISKSNDYIIGPAAEIRIPFGFAFEVDGLYRSTEYSLTNGSGTATIPAHAWEIPYLAKFRFPIPVLKPFISAGGAYRSFTDMPTNVTPTHNAFVAGGGLELRIKRLRLSAEGRWLHWNAPPENGNAVKLSQNQGELLFGIIF